jgi:hypothetical protein
MNSTIKRRSRRKMKFGEMLSVEQLVGLTAELQKVRHHPPLTRRHDGKYEGDILGFVKGLRLSARVIYFLRECLSETDFEVNWGHLLNAEEQACSPECDVVIHAKGHVRKWNGGEQPIMDFKFIRAQGVRAVVSCKSRLDSIDASYPKALKQFGIRKVFLFAECCRHDRLSALQKQAVKAGYGGLWCLYTTEKEPEEEKDNLTFRTDEAMYVEFGKAIRQAVRS